METHGGYGRLYSDVYYDVFDGIVFEKDMKKSDFLARQRPYWAVYSGDCIKAISAGVGNWMPVNWLDCDPYGSPWPVISAFFETDREFSSKMAIVVNDGLRLNAKMGGSHSVDDLDNAVQLYGNDKVCDNYLEICREMMKEKAARRGYSLSRWAGYYCGHNNQMTHYAAILEMC